MKLLVEKQPLAFLCAVRGMKDTAMCLLQTHLRGNYQTSCADRMGGHAGWHAQLGLNIIINMFCFEMALNLPWGDTYILSCVCLSVFTCDQDEICPEIDKFSPAETATYKVPMPSPFNRRPRGHTSPLNDARVSDLHPLYLLVNTQM